MNIYLCDILINLNVLYHVVKMTLWFVCTFLISKIKHSSEVIPECWFLYHHMK